MIGEIWQPADHDPVRSAVTLHRGRLARFLTGPTDQEYWSRHWQEDGQIEERLRRVDRGRLDQYDSLFERHARPGTYLEAGCGTGYVAEILRRRSLPVIAVDYDEHTIADVKQIFPALDVRVGDVENLALADESIANYISLGVVEHLEHGPEKAIKDAHRVLERNGRAFISVPDLNPARRSYEQYLKSHGAPPFSDACTFNYYYFDRDEFRDLLLAAGFVVDELVPLFKLDYLTAEHPIFSRFWRSPLCRERMKRPLRKLLAKQLSPLHGRYSHMMMYVCSKSG